MKKSGSDPDFPPTPDGGGPEIGVRPRFSAARRFAYFDHDADTGIIGRGATLAEAFVQAAEATFALMCDTDAVQPTERIDVEQRARRALAPGARARHAGEGRHADRAERRARRRRLGSTLRGRPVS